MLQGKKILVTGATGQIAGPIAENFAKDNEVWCAARFSDPKRKAELEAIGVKTFVWDMDSGDPSALPDDFTHVAHSRPSRGLAPIWNVTRSPTLGSEQSTRSPVT